MKKHQQTEKCKKKSLTYERKIEEERPMDLDNTNTPEPKTYTTAVTPGNYNKCPVENCSQSVSTSSEMRRHFRNRHLEHTIIIQGEGLLPRCTKCGLFQKSVDNKHQQTLDCIRFAIIKENRELAKRQATDSSFTFMVEGTPLQSVQEFKYLGRILHEKDCDDSAINQNLKRARDRWGRIGRILSKKGANAKIMGIFYKTIVQSILLYGSETWVISKQMLRMLRSFHRRCARFITGKHIWQDKEGNWHHPSSKEVLEMAGLKEIEIYIEQRKSTLMKYANERPIYKICKMSNPIASNVNQLVWWTNKLDSDA